MGTGISGVPGLGYSLPPKDGCDGFDCGLGGIEVSNANAVILDKSEWSANSAQNLAALKVDLPRVQHQLHHGHHPEIKSRTVSTSNVPPRLTKATAAATSYNGVSAVGHLMSDLQYFDRNNPNSSGGKRPLRATVSSRLRSKLSLPAAWPSQQQQQPAIEARGPSSLPSHFIPRAPIPTPEILAAKKKKTKLKPASSKHFSANNEAILKQDQHQYKSPKERDGDYSYAYDCSISPAVVIKWNEEEEEESEEEQAKTKSKSKDNENIYEEIADVAGHHHHHHDSSGHSSVNNSDSGIGGAVVSSLSSSGGCSASKGTLDVIRPRGGNKKRLMGRKQMQQQQQQPPSSLDALISQTSPDLTPHQRLDLRKSLVDELFEELIQRHHKRVLEELKLDVEEFIAPPSQHSYESSAVGTPKSTRSAQSAKLLRCESMDFKDRSSGGKESLKSTSATAAVPEKKIGPKLWQSARKCSEVIQKKLKKSHSNDHHPTNRKTIEHEKPQRPEQVTQVTRRGHRPLSAIVTKSSRTSNVIDTLEDDSDNEQEAAARRLLRSQIIKSFWEQHDNDNEEAHDDFNDNDNIEEYERL